MLLVGVVAFFCNEVAWMNCAEERLVVGVVELVAGGCGCCVVAT